MNHIYTPGPGDPVTHRPALEAVKAADDYDTRYNDLLERALTGELDDEILEWDFITNRVGDDFPHRVFRAFSTWKDPETGEPMTVAQQRDTAHEVWKTMVEKWCREQAQSRRDADVDA